VSTRPAPILVTGLPRSGTTWLAQQLARSPHTALPGREPMNPRGRQFALDGSLTGWARLDTGLEERKRRTLRRVYEGREPRVYGRYGVRPWAAPLPWVRVIVKDPFALLSLPAVTAATGARPVVLFRHPAALLASYRRMGWTPDVEDIRALGPAVAGDGAGVSVSDDDVGAMGWFWATCYGVVLRDLQSIPRAVVVDHARLAAGGESAMSSLVTALGLRPLRPVRPPATSTWRRRLPRDAPTAPRLHHLDREPAEVAEAWRREVDAGDISRLEELTAPVLRALADRSASLSAAGSTGGEAGG
jgi:hypothetical protein